MVVYQLFMTLLLFNCVKSFENNEFCQKRAIKDCTTKLSDVFEALEGTTKDQKFNKCAELQVRMMKKETSAKICLSLRLQSAYNIFKFLCNTARVFLLWKLTRIL